MSYTINGRAILVGAVHLPVTGIWSAWLTIDHGETLPTSSRGVSIDLGGTVLVGTIQSQGVYAGNLTARVVGGAGGLTGSGTLSKNVAAKKYRVVPARIPITDVLTEAGEILASSSSAPVLDVSLEHWSRPAVPAAFAFASLMRASSANWRVLPDGSVWVGTDAWPTAKINGEVLEEHPGARMRMVSPEVADLLPGTTIDGQRIEAVDYRIDAVEFRAELWHA